MVSTEPKRLAIFGAFKAWGGIERKVLILSESFLNLGVTPIIVLLRSGSFPYPDRLPQGTETVNLKTRGKLQAVPHIIRYLREARPDAVMTVDPHSAEAVLLARWVGRIRIPVYVKATNTLSQAVRRRGRRRMIRWLYPRADGIIAISRGVADDLATNFGIAAALIHVIYNPMITRDMKARLEKRPDHPWLSEDTQLPVILAAGRLSAQKGFDDLLKAFARVRREMPCRLIILGEGSERSSLESLVGELGLAGDIDLPGFVPDPLPWMAHASVFALSSRYEGLGNVLIEALAAGTPIVSTDCPSGPAEILEHGRHGTLVATGDVDAMAQALLETLRARPQARDPQATQRFEADRVARQYLDIMGLS